MKTSLTIVFLLTALSPAYAIPVNQEPQAEITELKEDVRVIAHDVEILRRDQTNYRIEKDLLKETYGSNLASVNLIITIVFGIFGVVGYLGVKSIKEIKADYSKELDTLRALKAEFEAELLSLTNKQRDVENQVTDLAKTNEEQDRRLKVLELIEKVSNFLQTRQWRWAQEYISVGLGLDPDNSQLLKIKAMCHGKLGEIDQQIEATLRILELEPKNISMVSNLLEAYAIRQNPAFHKMYETYKTEIDVLSGGAMPEYLGGVFKLMSGQQIEAVGQLTRFADTCSERPKPYLGTWSFDEIELEVSKLPAGNQKTLLLKTIEFFKGVLTPEGFKAALAAA